MFKGLVTKLNQGAVMDFVAYFMINFNLLSILQKWLW